MTLGIGMRWVVEACRSAQNGPADAFAQSALFDTADLGRFIPISVLDDLNQRRQIIELAGTSRLGLRCHNFHNLVSIMPLQQEFSADFVHINGDTFWLLRLIWAHAACGEYAAELGTGNGIVAAHLVARYRRVIATDLPGPWIEYAQMTLGANAGRGRPSAVLACDVASALRPGSFDLVAANAPWSPAAPLDTAGNEMTFMAGGPTGTELPARFLREGAELLRPGGTAITLCLDPEFDDGSRPLMPVLDSLSAAGYEVECIDSEVFETDFITTRLRDTRLPTLTQARHIAVIVRC